ncbi:MAG: TrkA family potassium uptake protein [Proteobacteria bacterium]|nr:TrkA family potassium uptake protein [Pseudomonadota bacterium]
MTHAFAVIGLGRFGSSVARTLSQKGYPVLVIDSKKELIEEISSEVSAAVQSDTTDKDSLLELEIQKFSCVVVGIGASSLEASILTTALLSQIGCARIISRGIHALHEKVLRSVGAHEVINPEEELGRRLAERLSQPYLLEQFNLGHDLRLSEISTPQRFVNKSLQDLKLRNRYNVSVVALYRGDMVIASPKATEIIQSVDKLVLVGSSEDIQKLASIS